MMIFLIYIFTHVSTQGINFGVSDLAFNVQVPDEW